MELTPENTPSNEGQEAKENSNAGLQGLDAKGLGGNPANSIDGEKSAQIKILEDIKQDTVLASIASQIEALHLSYNRRLNDLLRENNISSFSACENQSSLLSHQLVS